MQNSMLQQNELITFFTADGIVQIPGRAYHVPRRTSVAQQHMPTWEEQTLCIGQTFQVAAWSRDPNRCVGVLRHSANQKLCLVLMLCTVVDILA